MSALSFLETLIDLTIKALIFWFTSNIYILLQFIFNSIGIFGILFDLQFFGSDILGLLHRILIFIINIFLYLNGSGLLWIFVFWMIIKIFVPYILLIPIPIIPFILPIPLKTLMLEFIPPFALLTKRGILPLCEKITLNFLFSNSTIQQKFAKTFANTYDFLYLEIKNIIGDIYKKPEKEPEENYKIRTIDDGTNNEKKAKEIKKEDNNDKNKEIMELINEELEICLQSKQSLTSPNSSIFNGMNNLKNYADCYSKSVRSYIDNKI